MIFKRTAITLLSVAVLVSAPFIFPTTSTASSPVKSSEDSVHLKVNDYFVLFTSPRAPYVDSKQRLMVPLRAVSELFGANVTYSASTRAATIKMDGHQLIVKNGSKEVIQDEKKLNMDTIPVLYKDSMIIPLKALLDGFNIKGSIDQEFGYVTIKDDRLLKTPIMSNFEEFDTTMDAHIENENAFVPLFSKVSISSESKSSTSKVTVTITAKNRTGKDVPVGREDLHPVFLSKGSYVLDSDKKTTDGSVRVRPAVDANDTFQRTWNFSLEKNDPLLYVLAKGRTFNIGIK